MAVSVAIPFCSDDPWRVANLPLIAAQYEGFDVIVAGAPGAWCKARSVDVCLAQVTGDILIIADADCLCDGINEAVAAVEDGAAWAMPHLYVKRLTPLATEARRNGHPATETAEKRYQGTRGGGIVVLPTDTYRNVPLDPRFEGWGQEDASLAMALDLLAGPCVRLEHDLWHLWHPPPERDTRVYGSRAGRLLNRRYWQARNNPEAMRQIIDEAKEAMWTPCT